MSGVRWATVEKILEREGIVRPALNFSKLVNAECLRAFNLVVENRYRYYQFYSNSLIALVIAYGAWHESENIPPWRNLWVMMGFVAVVGILYWSARDSLKGYYKEAEQVLGGKQE